MKFFGNSLDLALLAFSFAASSHAAAIDPWASGEVAKRQLGAVPEHQIGRAKIQSVQMLTPKLNKNAIRKKITFGPYLVPGSQVFDSTMVPQNEAHERQQAPSIGQTSDHMADASGSLAVVDTIENFCGGACSILWGGAVPYFENGTSLSEVGGSIYNHHIFTVNRGRRVPEHICPGESAKVEMGTDPFIGGGTEQEYMLYTSPDGSFKSGYELKAADKVDLVFELMNYRPQSQRIHISVDFEYLPGNPDGLLNSQSLILSAAPCKQMAFNVPSKQYTTTSEDWIVPVDATIINARGHQHDGGSGVHLSVNGKPVCSSIPTYSKVESRGQNEEEHYTIKEMSLCGTQYQLKKGDRLKVKANYDIEKYPQRVGNMGHMETVTAILELTLGIPAGADVASLW